MKKALLGMLIGSAFGAVLWYFHKLRAQGALGLREAYGPKSEWGAVGAP